MRVFFTVSAPILMISTAIAIPASRTNTLSFKTSTMIHQHMGSRIKPQSISSFHLSITQTVRYTSTCLKSCGVLLFMRSRPRRATGLHRDRFREEYRVTLSNYYGHQGVINRAPCRKRTLRQNGVHRRWFFSVSPKTSRYVKELQIRQL